MIVAYLKRLLPSCGGHVSYVRFSVYFNICFLSEEYKETLSAKSQSLQTLQQENSKLTQQLDSNHKEKGDQGKVQHFGYSIKSYMSFGLFTVKLQPVISFDELCFSSSSRKSTPNWKNSWRSWSKGKETCRQFVIQVCALSQDSAVPWALCLFLRKMSAHSRSSSLHPMMTHCA